MSVWVCYREKEDTLADGWLPRTWKAVDALRRHRLKKRVILADPINGFRIQQNSLM